MAEDEQHHLAADQIALHIVGAHADEREKALYLRAMRTFELRLTDAEMALWESMLRSRRMMAWADAGLALLRPSSVLRQKILVMVAILETSPRFADYFLPRRCPLPRAFPVAAAAIRGAFRGVVGLILVKTSGV
jgi:hypothetical protein